MTAASSRSLSFACLVVGCLALVAASCSSADADAVSQPTQPEEVATFCSEAPLDVSEEPGDHVRTAGVQEGSEFCLGPALLDGAALASAEARLDNRGSWTIAPHFRNDDPGIDLFNEAASICFQMQPACPTGRLAIVVRGNAGAAPTLEAPTFDWDQVVLAGEGIGPELANEMTRLLGEDPSMLLFRPVLAVTGEKPLTE